MKGAECLVKCPLSAGAAQADFALAEALAASRLSYPQGEVPEPEVKGGFQGGAAHEPRWLS